MHTRLVNQIAVRFFSSPLRRSLTTGLVLLGLSPAAEAQFYAVTDLGTLGGSNGMAYGINNHEQIVGTAQTALGNYHAFMFDGGRMIDLGTLGGSNSWAYGINDMGWMVGAADLPMTNMHAFVCTNALQNPVMMDMGTLGGSNSAGWMIDMFGDMVGWAAITNGSHHAFFMTNLLMNQMMDLGTAGGTNSVAYCINSNRMVVGYTMMSNGGMEPIMSTNGLYGSSSMMTMGMGSMGGGASGGQSWSVNNLGQEAGRAQMSGGNHHAFATGSSGMMGRTMVDFGTLGGTNSSAYCINDAGTVVGTTQMGSGLYHAFMVTNALGGMARMLDLNALIPTNSGWQLIEARGINMLGQIIGWGMRSGHTNAFLLTPVSGPSIVTATPTPAIVGPGAMVTLQIQMNASDPLNYQWLHNGMPMPTATNSTLSWSGIMGANVGSYTVTVRNAIGTVGIASTSVSLFGMQARNGKPQLMLAGPTGTQFRIDATETLGLGAGWQTMTNFIMTGSMIQLIAAPPGDLKPRFYRASLVQ